VIKGCPGCDGYRLETPFHLLCHLSRAAFLGWWQLARVKAGHSRAVAQHLGARHARSLCTVVLHAWHDLASSLARERRDFPLLCR
jgi:hypothetical protein